MALIKQIASHLKRNFVQSPFFSVCFFHTGTADISIFLWPVCIKANSGTAIKRIPIRAKQNHIQFKSPLGKRGFQIFDPAQFTHLKGTVHHLVKRERAACIVLQINVGVGIYTRYPVQTQHKRAGFLCTTATSDNIAPNYVVALILFFAFVEAKFVTIQFSAKMDICPQAGTGKLGFLVTRPAVFANDDLVGVFFFAPYEQTKKEKQSKQIKKTFFNIAIKGKL